MTFLASESADPANLWMPHSSAEFSSVHVCVLQWQSSQLTEVFFLYIFSLFCDQTTRCEFWNKKRNRGFQVGRASSARIGCTPGRVLLHSPRKCSRFPPKTPFGRENRGYAFWEFPKREFASGGLVFSRFTGCLDRRRSASTYAGATYMRDPSRRRHEQHWWSSSPGATYLYGDPPHMAASCADVRGVRRWGTWIWRAADPCTLSLGSTYICTGSGHMWRVPVKVRGSWGRGPSVLFVAPAAEDPRCTWLQGPWDQDVFFKDCPGNLWTVGFLCDRVDFMAKQSVCGTFILVGM